MLYRLFNLLLFPFRCLLFLLFGIIGLLFIPFDALILWPLAYLFFGLSKPFFIGYFDWFIYFVFDDWI